MSTKVLKNTYFLLWSELNCSLIHKLLLVEIITQSFFLGVLSARFLAGSLSTSFKSLRVCWKRHQKFLLLQHFRASAAFSYGQGSCFSMFFFCFFYLEQSLSARFFGFFPPVILLKTICDTESYFFFFKQDLSRFNMTIYYFIFNSWLK